MKKVFLVTKLKSTNIGNQALSMELIKLFEEHVGKKNLNVSGRPIGLYAYSMKDLASSEEPEILFDTWADAVIKKYRSLNADKPFVPKIDNFKLTRRPSTLKYENMKVLLRPVKRFVKRISLFDKTYVDRLASINSCDVFIYSGAGEVSDNHVFLRQLLEIRIAQKLGKQTGAVNQSLIVSTELFKKIVKHVYGQMNQIVVRGAISKSDIASFGVDEKKIHIAPDSAIRTTTEQIENHTGTVGFNITPLLKYEWKDIEKIATKLKQYNKKMVFVTNEPLGDLPIIARFKAEFNIDALEEARDYRDYARQLTAFDYVISARLHTNVISLAVNVPVIPIEGMVFKTKELFEQFEYPIRTVNVNEPGWSDALISNIEKMECKTIDFDAYFKNVLRKHKADVQDNATWINNN